MEEEPSCSTSTKHNEWELGRTTVSPMDMNTDESQSQAERVRGREGTLLSFLEKTFALFPEEKTNAEGLKDDSILATKVWGDHKFDVDFRALSTLKPKQYLNDTAIDYGMAVMLNKVEADVEEVIYIESCSFEDIMKPLTEPFPENALNTFYRRIFPKHTRRDVINAKFIVFPISQGKHWFLAIVCNPFPSVETMAEWDKRLAKCDTTAKREEAVSWLYSSWLWSGTHKPIIYILDSMRVKLTGKVNYYDEFLENTGSFIKRALMEVHREHWRRTERPFPKDHEIPFVFRAIQHRALEVSQQPNEYDCGLFIIAFVTHFFRTITEKTEDVDVVVSYLASLCGNAPLIGKIQDLRLELVEEIKLDCAFQHPELSEAVEAKIQIPLSDVKTDSDSDGEMYFF